jgi:hypothetical protein
VAEGTLTRVKPQFVRSKSAEANCAEKAANGKNCSTEVQRYYYKCLGEKSSASRRFESFSRVWSRIKPRGPRSDMLPGNAMTSPPAKPSGGLPHALSATARYLILRRRFWAGYCRRADVDNAPGEPLGDCFVAFSRSDGKAQSEDQEKQVGKWFVV